MTDDLRPPYRIAFDNARDPYTARNALGIAGTGAGLITSATPPLSITGGVISIDLSGYQLVTTTDPSPPQGRLTLTTLTPVMTTTQSAKTTIFYTPYVGNKVPIYDGTNMTMTTFAELSVATTDTTKSPAAIGASKVNDWFVWNDAGTIRIGHGPDWTSDTARSAGTALVMVKGVLLNNAAITNGPAASRGTYVGTTRSNASSQLDWIFGGLGGGGVAAFFGVWNAYNRVAVSTMVRDGSSSWTYSTATWRAANGSATFRTSFVSGLDEDAITATYAAIYNGNAVQGANGIGLDSTTAFVGTDTVCSVASSIVTQNAMYSGLAGIGFHFVAGLEYAGGSVTWWGAATAYAQSGLHVNLRM